MFLVVGCNSIPKATKYYDGPKKNDAEVTVFSFWMNQKFKGEFSSYAKVYPKSLNGKDIPPHSTFSVIPGTHKLTAACMWNEQEFTHVYEIHTLKGKNYAIVVDVTDKDCNFRELQYISESNGFTKIDT